MYKKIQYDAQQNNPPNGGSGLGSSGGDGFQIVDQLGPRPVMFECLDHFHFFDPVEILLQRQCSFIGPSTSDKWGEWVVDLA